MLQEMQETEPSPPEELQTNDSEHSKLATMFHVAACKGHIQLLELLLKQHPSLLDDRDSKGFTPLQRALEHSQIKCAEFLFSRLFCSLLPLIILHFPYFNGYTVVHQLTTQIIWVLRRCIMPVRLQTV